ncbi:MAG: NADPH-dependent FMN reductase [Thermoplasmataceae archaeon]
MITAIGGSLRKDSYNRKLIEFCQKNMPEGAELIAVDISGIENFNPENIENTPQKIEEIRDVINKSQGVLVVSPEYNYSIPGFLKNVLDWLSQPPTKNPFKNKPVALMSASPGMLGGSRAQYHLRQIFQYLDADVIRKPEVFISFADQMFDSDNNIKNQMSIKFILELLNKLVDSGNNGRR